MPATENEEITSYDEANDRIIDRFDEGETGSAVEDDAPVGAAQEPEESPEAPSEPEAAPKEPTRPEVATEPEPEPQLGQWSFRGEQIEEQDAQELMEYGVRYIQLLQQQQEEQARAQSQPQPQPQSQAQPQAPRGEKPEDPVSRLERELSQLKGEWQQEREAQKQREEAAQIEYRKNQIIQDVRTELEKDEFFKQIPAENKELRAQLEGIALLQLYNASRAGKRVGTKDAVAQAVGALKSFVSSSSSKFLQGAVSQSKNPQPGSGGTPPAQKARQWTAEDAFSPGHTEFVDHLIEQYKNKF